VTPDALVEWAKAQMAPYKAPRRVFVVDDLPRGSTHKVLKKELKQRYRAEAPEAERPA
jgi:long-chain acyl-CoA synthetase